METFNDFLLQIERAQEELKCSNSGAWYRGLTSVEFALIPKLFRSRVKPDAEANIYRDYLRTRMADQHLGSWRHLIDMQHYGIPTRLLDWTESFAVALCFALAGKSGDSDSPCIWILNPFSLATRGRGENNKSMGDFHLDQTMDYYDRFVRLRNWKYKYPMPFNSPTPNERIRVQRGFFTVHGNDTSSLDKTCRRHIRQVLLPKTAISEARRFLKLAGVDYDFLFPDYEGWQKRVERDYFYSPEEISKLKH